MARPEFANMLEMSNQQLIDNLNSRRYAPTPIGFQQGAGYSDPYAGLETMIAQNRASQAYADVMASQAKSEAMHNIIGTSLMAVPYAGLPLSMMYDPITQALGLRDPKEVYTQEDYVKGMMAESIYGAAYGNMSSAFLGNRLSMDQAQSLTDDMYGFMRQRGFQGLEISRIAPMLGEAGMFGQTGSFSSADEALNELGNRLEGFLDKVTNIARSTSMNLEQATAMTISQSMLAGQRGAVPGMDYIESAQAMSNLTGMDIGSAESAMRGSLGAWGGTTYDRTGMAQAATFNAAAAVTAGGGGGRWDAAWVGVDAGQFGLRMANYGNQYWYNNRNTLARLYSAGAMPGTDAWNSMVAGEGIPESIASYGDIGDVNARYEAQYFGMQMAAENPNMMTASAMGTMVNQMSEAGVHSREAQIMYMVGKGYTQADATRYLNTYDQYSTARGRFGIYGTTAAANLSADIGAANEQMANAMTAVGYLSAENSPAMRGALGGIVGSSVLNGRDIMGAVSRADQRRIEAATGGAWGLAMDLDPTGIISSFRNAAGFDADIYDQTSDNRVNTALMMRAAGGVLARNYGMGDTRQFNAFGMLRNPMLVGGATSEATAMTLDALSGSSDADLIRMLGGMTFNTPGLDIGRGSILSQVKVQMMMNGGGDWQQISDAEALRHIRRVGLGNMQFDIGGGMHSFGELFGGGVSGVTVGVGTGVRGLFNETILGAFQEFGENRYQSQLDLNRMMGYRFSGGDAENSMMALAARGGYFEDVEMGGSYAQFGGMSAQMDSMMYLGRVNESSQGYYHDPAHSTNYREFLSQMSNQGFTMGDATSGLDHRTAEGQMEARNRLASAGFGKAYAQLSNNERNYIEEYMHANDNSGEQGSRNWAGRHDDIAADSHNNLLTSMEEVTFGVSEATTDRMQAAAETYGVTQSDMEAYAAWQIAKQEGASAEDQATLFNRIGGNLDDVERAVRQYQEGSGSWRGAMGELVANRAYTGIMRASELAGLEDAQFRQVWEQFRTSGSFEGLDQTTRQMLSDAGYDLSSAEKFFAGGKGEVPTWLVDDQNTNRLTSIPEFQGAMNAVVTPAGGAMPVVMVGGRLGFNLSGFDEVYNGDSETAQSTTPRERPSE